MGTTSLPAATWKCPQCGEEGTSFLPDESCSCDYYPDGASLTPEGWKATLRAQQFLRERSERIAELLDYGKESFDYTYADREDGTITAHWETCCARGCCSPKGHTADFPSRYIWMTDADILVEEKLKKETARKKEAEKAHLKALAEAERALVAARAKAATAAADAQKALDQAKANLSHRGLTMAYHIEVTTSNGYRCACCKTSHTSSKWVETPEEALDGFPLEFPTEGEWSGEISRIVKDGTTGRCVAESSISWPYAYTRGDGYKFTHWSALVLEDVFPGQGRDIDQIIEGRNYGDTIHGDSSEEPRAPLVFVTDQTWGEICEALKEKKRLWDIQHTENQIVEAQKKLAALRGY